MQRYAAPQRTPPSQTDTRHLPRCTHAAAPPRETALLSWKLTSFWSSCSPAPPPGRWRKQPRRAALGRPRRGGRTGSGTSYAAPFASQGCSGGGCLWQLGKARQALREAEPVQCSRLAKQAPRMRDRSMPSARTRPRPPPVRPPCCRPEPPPQPALLRCATRPAGSSLWIMFTSESSSWLGLQTWPVLGRPAWQATLTFHGADDAAR